MQNKPKYIFLENVVNFERSQTRARLIQVLESSGYEYEEWMLSPLDFGIPNERPRYYLIAWKNSNVEGKERKLNVGWPSEPLFTLNSLSISEFIAPTDMRVDQELSLYRIPDKLLRNRGSFDAVAVARPNDVRTPCFTKAYGHYGVSSGGFLQTQSGAANSDSHSEILLRTYDAVEKLGLRLFTPTE